MNETKTWDLRVHLVEQGSETAADVLLTTDSGTVIRARGVARRNPRDPDVPSIGDEVACARAMTRLAHKLLEAAAKDISRIEHRPVQLRS
ncbi:DUF1876 domain-containing protein [Bailinhaonella thermotolerans]|uniref:DUF1876 domain-containing protein n=1 Tax=Bailinhaonella thermotolerans TaxID=1070861 RepID=A0A3A4AW25_9ACTN|nr:DUF1876 domain-containing protein [Bailinhaonella thermotolerans]RJL34430.1 DUF1876 domain-containing protein [Bailinhaonella thermotolerans]